MANATADLLFRITQMQIDFVAFLQVGDGVRGKVDFQPRNQRCGGSLDLRLSRRPAQR